MPMLLRLVASGVNVVVWWVGVQEGAIVARMSAVEEMAGMDILCSDKTGTLTLNELTVDKPNVVVVPKGMSTDEVRCCCRLLVVDPCPTRV